MSALPVIERELRVAARQPRTYYYRLAFAVGGIVVAFIFFAFMDLQPFERSRQTLSLLAVLCAALCQFAGCFLTADCLSAEKREGTLGLLFLTPLRAGDIVLGKMMTHSLSVIYGLLAIFPMFFLTLLNGGVTGGEVVRLVLAMLPAMLLSLAAGMYFSARHEEARAAVVATFLFMVAINLVPFVDYLTQSAIRYQRPGIGDFLPWESALAPSFTIIYAFDSIQRGPPLAKALYWAGLGLQTALALGLLVLAGRRLRRGLQVAGTASAPAARHPVPRGARPPIVTAPELSENPCYLHYRAASGETPLLSRCRRILLAATGVSLVAAVFGDRYMLILVSFLGMAILHVAAKFLFILEICRHTNRDRHGGALELLLCTALPEREIRAGYVQGVTDACWPAYRWIFIVNAIVLFFCYGFQKPLHMNNKDLWVFTLFYVGGMAVAATDFYAIRWRGAYYGLTARNQTRAIFMTFAEILAVPWVLLAVCIGIMATSRANDGTIIGFLVFWYSFSIIYAVYLARRARAALEGHFRQLASGG